MYHNKVINSDIHENSDIHDLATIINSKIAEYCFVGKFSTVTYSNFDIYSYISQFSIIKSTDVGKFTSISWGCSIGPEDHDYNRGTNHSFLASTKAFNLCESKQYDLFSNKCKIGNDVWIGCNSTILRGVEVGDGAVVGANSVVTEDVPPYAIVAGVPAKIIKYRFPEEIISSLIDIKWWDFNEILLKKIVPLLSEKMNIEIINKIKLIYNER